MRSIFLSLCWAIILVCALFLSAPLTADPAPSDPRIDTLEEQAKAQNQQLNEIQKKLETYDTTNRDLTHTLEKAKLTQEVIKDSENKNQWLFATSVAVATISVMIFLGIIGYGAYSYKGMNDEIKKARADAKEVEGIKTEAHKFKEEFADAKKEIREFKEEFADAKKEIREFREEREKFIQEDRITRFKTFAAIALSLSTAWEKATDEERERLWDQANYYYKQAISLQPEPIKEHREEYASTLNNLGILLSKQAQSTKDPDLWTRASECYQQSTTIRPDDAETWNNWGAALSEQARLTNDPFLWPRADECYQKATAIKPDFAEAWNNWGTALLDQVNSMDNLESPIWQKINDFYQKAVSIKPEYAGAWRSWGFALSNQAKLANDPSSILWKQVNDCYQKATTINPKFFEAWNNWGTALWENANLPGLDSAQKISLLEEAEEKFTRAAELGFEPSKGFLKQCQEEIARLKAEYPDDGESGSPPTTDESNPGGPEGA